MSNKEGGKNIYKLTLSLDEFLLKLASIRYSGSKATVEDFIFFDYKRAFEVARELKLIEAVRLYRGDFGWQLTPKGISRSSRVKMDTKVKEDYLAKMDKIVDDFVDNI